MRTSHRRLGGLISFLLVSLSQMPARAAIYYGPAWGPPWGYYSPVYVMPRPHMLELDGQVFEPTVSGISDLCALHPDFCATPAQQLALHRLTRDRAIGWSLMLSGLAVAVVGPIVGFAQRCQPSYDGEVCSPNWPVIGSTLGAGLGLSIAGGIVMPGHHDILNFVNVSNIAHPQTPIKLQVGLSQSGANVRLAAQFD